MVSALRYHAKAPGFALRPWRSLLRLISSQVLPAHSAVMSRLGMNLVEGKAARERTGHRPHMPWPRIEQSLTLPAPVGLIA